MDLSRWSLKNFGRELRELNRMLGDVLDADLPAAPEDEVRDAFDVSDSTEDLDRELALVRPGASPEKVLSALVPFYEGGVCLRVTGDRTFMTSLFLFGQAFTPAEAHGTPVDFGLRGVEMSHVYKMDLKPILKALNLEPFFRLDGASAFAFAVLPDCLFVLFDNRPHPWQVLAIENGYLSTRDTFARIAGLRATRGLFK
jgi:hypothetical protein